MGIAFCALLPGNVKVVNGGFGSGGKWVETGNRLPDNWTPLPVGQCFTQTSSSQIQAQAYGGDGTTCSFQKYETYMPKIHKDGYYIAASNDAYNGFHFPDDWQKTPRSPQWSQCTYNTTFQVFYNSSNFQKMCGQGCGECYQITGPTGSYTFIVNEVNDINTVGLASGQGFVLVLGNGAGPKGFGPAPCRGANGVLDAGECNLKVMNYGGPTSISVKKVPCPVEGNIVLGVKGYSSTPLDGSNSELVVLHHRLGIQSMWIQGRNASGSPSGWKWVPRDWTNRFLFEPVVGLNGKVFDQSTTKTFDIKFRGTYGADLICSNIVWKPTALVNDTTRGIQLLGNCQFPDPGIDKTPCPAAFPPNPVISNQFYSYGGSGPNDCPSLNTSVAGCSVKTEGYFPNEWRDWGSYGLSPFPNYGFTADCNSGGRCIDSTNSTNYAGIQIGWAQGITTSQFPQITSFRYYAKCKSATCNNIKFSIRGGTTSSLQTGCAAVFAPPVSFTNTWAQYTVNMTQLLANCTTYFQVIQWTFGPGIRFYLDDAAFYCGNSICANTAPTSAPRSSSLTNSSSINSGVSASDVILGVSIAIIVVAVITLIIAFIIYKRRNNQNKNLEEPLLNK